MSLVVTSSRFSGFLRRSRLMRIVVPNPTRDLTSTYLLDSSEHKECDKVVPVSEMIISWRLTLMEILPLSERLMVSERAFSTSSCIPDSSFAMTLESTTSRSSWIPFCSARGKNLL